MRLKLKVGLTILLSCISIFIYGQQTVTVQPKIMVIPFTKEGEDIRTILEADVNRRIAITKIKEAFDSRGFTTVDFTARLKAAKDNNIFTSDNQTDIKSQIIEMSGADIYVQAEVSEQKGQSGNSVTLILTGYEASTGNSLSNKVGESGRFYTDDFGKLASKSVENIAEDFLNIMQAKFTDIVNNGKSIIIDISFDAGSQYTMSSEIGSEGLLLSDEIEMWMEKNAFKNNYHIQGTTKLKMIFDDVRIPLKDQATGNNYNPNKFALEMHKFFRGIGLQIGRDVKGSTIYITIK
ncbi:DUF6175 family protein [Sphingobacterium lumbrici]|uniref:DUF6175 family protein n=1 Tax=Sphingobacterium lumbrici TaxID=2559600 RepID=UPI001128E9C3|nr:DUF6175 family protein [Sphingobacterium lumbrici]